MDKVRTARWILAPLSTLTIRRWMILLEERSYETANERWWTRKQAKWDRQQRSQRWTGMAPAGMSA
jgi:hypothetical protein